MVFVRRLPAPQLFSFLILAGLAACGDAPESVTAPAPDPAEPLRIVTLAPHLAELVYAAGAGDTLVGVSAYSNYPEPVNDLPLIGDAFLIDQEQLLLLRPDILLAWQSGTASHTVDALRARDYRVELIRTNGLDDIADALKSIGSLTDRETIANSVAASFVMDIERLRLSYADAEPIRVFYQIASRPLYTANGNHYVSELIELCGGVNIFGDIGELAPLVSEEAVLVRDPEVMIAGRIVEDEFPLSSWRRWPTLSANILDNYFYIPADLLARPTPRLIQAGEKICAALQQARINRTRRIDY